PSGTSKFTCLTCQVAFATSELQRSHYHTDWHKYNLKRKVAELVPVSAEQFIEKVTALQAQDQEEREQSFLAYNCAICRKRYGSEAAFKSHLRSRKHNESKHDQGISMADEFMTVPTNTATVMTMGDTQRDSCLHCLFCDERQDQFSDNIHHMSVSHGFFLPDIEYLVDAQGLVKYLSTKIQSDYMCLYCNKTLKSAQAAMSHMVNKGHCKMAYDDTEDVDALLRYYDFGSPLNENDDDVSTTTIASEEGELILHDGTRLGNRRLLKYYKQK
ncbi:zinc finger protein 622-like protein, partial [Halteromyces radiatus]|uniref:zinc finger protein 622-like protein n=1 Tax=Halteromyces radiatus TaxID=101107 RepID=UPI0022210178